MQISEATAIVGIIILIASNIVALAVAVRNAGKKEGGDEAKMKELVEKVSALPCIKDPNYMASTGELRGIVKIVADQFSQMSESLAQVNQRLDNWIDKSRDNNH
jgi:hypothetical protein